MRALAPCLIPLLALTAAASNRISTLILLAPHTSLPTRVASAGGLTATERGDGWLLSGEGGGSVRLAPARGQAWDLGGWNFARVELANLGEHVITVDGRLDNMGAQDWTDSSPASAVVPPGGTATLGFPFTRADATYQGAEIFRPQLARPNGHRLHWRGFDPARVREVRLVLRAPGGPVRLAISGLRPAWPGDPARDAALETMPYLDAFGQVRALDWPGKIESEDALRAQLLHHAQAVSRAGWPAGFDRFGGWADGPQLEATGHFRTQKLDGRWWLVDPDGRLFWSAGVCCVGWNAETTVTPERRAAGFFAELPETNHPSGAFMIRGKERRESMNFPALNAWRVFGSNWTDSVTELIHGQLHVWGLNTLGAWSDEQALRAGRTPYTLTTGVWWPIWRDDQGHRPSPFAADFAPALRANLEKLAWARNDPYCLGVFVDNELAWPDQLAPLLLAAPEWEPTRRWALERMRARYPELTALNAAWGITAANWNDVFPAAARAPSATCRADLDALYEDYARAYFAGCRRVINEVLPGKLYLGCRTHRGPKVLGRAAQGAVDVFSVNCYDTRPAVHQLDERVDMPVLVGEYHFGAADRGVPSPGLCAVADQRQRGLAAARYLAAGISNPRIVGCHWFQWLDQPASGRGDRENHQVGFLDVTGRPYREFVQALSAATFLLPSLRARGINAEQALQEMLSAPSRE